MFTARHVIHTYDPTPSFPPPVAAVPCPRVDLLLQLCFLARAGLLSHAPPPGAGSQGSPPPGASLSRDRLHTLVPRFLSLSSLLAVGPRSSPGLRCLLTHCPPAHSLHSLHSFFAQLTSTDLFGLCLPPPFPYSPSTSPSSFSLRAAPPSFSRSRSSPGLFFQDAQKREERGRQRRRGASPRG